MAEQLPSRRTQGNRGTLAGRRGDPFGLLRNQFDELFGRFFGGMPLAPFGEDFGEVRLWDFDTTENDKEIVVRAELPGFEPDDIQVELNNNTLTIEAQKRREGEGEVSYRDFRRAVTLPQAIDPEGVQASYRNGVLELHIPKSEAGRGKRIPVQGDKEGGQSRIAHGDSKNAPGSQHGGSQTTASGSKGSSKKA